MVLRFKMSFHKLKPFLIFICVILAAGGLVGRIYSYAITITNYPLATSWSESGRIFEASTILSTLLYKQPMSWPWLDPGRAILSSLIFLLPNSQIWMYRLWQIILDLSTTVLTVVLVLKATRIESYIKIRAMLLGGVVISWGILYFLQGPMNYHVLLGTIIVLWFYDPKKPFSSLFIVVLTSIWEGLGRVNWFLMPAVLTTVLYILTTPVKNRQVVRYYIWPALWLIAGGLFSFITYAIFIKLTHKVIPFFDPNMHYGFFIFKLWPNTLFTLG